MITHHDNGGWELAVDSASNVLLDHDGEQITFDAGGDKFTFAFAADYAIFTDPEVALGSTGSLRITAEPSGFVKLDREGSLVLSVSPSPNIEAWEVTAEKAGFLAVCGVGGGTSGFRRIGS